MNAKSFRIAASVLVFAAVSGDALAVNLLENPSNDEPLVGANIPGWIEVLGANWTQRSEGPPPFEGSSYFFPGVVRDAELAQDVDVTGFSAAIDGGAQAFNFAGYVRSFSQGNSSDESRIVLEYRNAAGEILDSFDSGGIDNTTEWQLVVDSRNAPVGTRTIRVRLISTRRSGSNNDGYYDALSLTLAGAGTEDTCDGLAVTLAGTEGDDFMLGTPAADVVAGFGGNDVIYGLDGHDVVCGGPGDDTILGGNGNDKLYGEAGNDVLLGGAGNDLGDGGPGRDRLFGDAQNDTLTGAAGNDYLNGGDGADRLSGAAGKDVCDGAGGTSDVAARGSCESLLDVP